MLAVPLLSTSAFLVRLFYTSARHYVILLFGCTLLLGLCEAYFVSHSQLLFEPNSGISFSDHQSYFSNGMALLFFSVILIVPLRLAFTYLSSAAISRFARVFVEASTFESINDWRTTDDSLSVNNRHFLLYEQDILFNDIFPSGFNALLAISVVIWLLVDIAQGIQVFHVFVCLLGAICLGLIIILPLYKQTRLNAINSSNSKNLISELTNVIFSSVRTIKSNAQLLHYVSASVSRNEHILRLNLSRNLVFSIGIKSVFEFVPYFILAVITFYSRVDNQLANADLPIGSAQSLGSYFILIMRLGSYFYLLYTSAYVILTNLKRGPSFLFIAISLREKSLHRHFRWKSSLTSNSQISSACVSSPGCVSTLSISFKDAAVSYRANSSNIAIGTFDLCTPAFVGISAPSGTGKTTLFDIIMSNNSLSSGSFCLTESGNSVNESSHLCHYIPQRPALIFRNIASNVCSHPLAQHDLRTNVREDLWRIFSCLGVFDNYSEFAYELTRDRGPMCDSLSGGEKQVVSIAQAVYMGKRIIIADEPTASLDKLLSHNVISLLRATCLKRNALVIIASHKKAELSSCDILLHKESAFLPFNVDVNRA